MRYKKPIYKPGDKVVLVNDPRDTYTIVEMTGTSKGPVRQYDEAFVYKVTDEKERFWQFREDSLKLK